MHASIKRPVRLALVSALLAGFGAHAAAAEPFLSANSSLSNLTFQLIDLDPTDGIAPSFTLMVNGTAVITPLDLVGGDFLNPETTGVPLAGSSTPQLLPTLTQGAPSAQVSITPTSVKLNSSLSTDGLTQMPVYSTYSYADGPQLITVTDTGQTIGGGNAVSFTLAGLSDTLDPQTQWWSTQLSGRLSANTALLITGQASVSVLADRSVLEAQAAQSLSDNVPMTYGAHIRAAIDLSLTGSSYGPQDGSSADFRSSFSLQEDVGMSGGMTTYYDNIDGIYHDLADLTLARTSTRNFSLVGYNTSSAATDVALDISMDGTAAQIFNAYKSTTVITDNPDWVPPTTTPTIPEPSTYALMGLGLVGLSLVARRQRPRNT